MESTSLFLGSLVSILTLLGTVWWSAITVNNMQRDVSSLKKDLSSVQETMISTNELLLDRATKLNQIEASIEDVLVHMVKLVYVNSNHVLFETHDGDIFKVPLFEG
jgi:translation initiation factor 2 beta subunit (eIF-2beta)/eIF-5